MARIPLPILRKCTDVANLKVACPTQMPKVNDVRSRARAFRTGRSWVFFAEWSAPYPGPSTRNAPPRFAHLNVIATPVNHPLAFTWPLRATATLEDLENAPKKRGEPLLLGEYTWGGRNGEIALAPSFPAGGIEGAHLVFRWVEDDTAYSVSLHAWKPIDQSFDALKSVVASIIARCTKEQWLSLSVVGTGDSLIDRFSNQIFSEAV